jgi:hypothetical protein
MKRRLSLIFATTLSAALTLVALGSAPVAASDGCTPGYWKQEQHFWAWTYDTDADFDTVFGVDFFDPDETLLDVLWLQGDKTGINKFAAHAVAGLLNAAYFGNPTYWETEAGVIALVQAVNPGSTPKANIVNLKDRLDDWNNSGCPLGGAP